MWIVAVISYLFIGFVIGSGVCIAADDNPKDPDSVKVIIITGFIWPVILIIIAGIALVYAAIGVAETMFIKQPINDNREEKDSNA